jgi:hypothetical protein
MMYFILLLFSILLGYGHNTIVWDLEKLIMLVTMYKTYVDVPCAVADVKKFVILFVSNVVVCAF